MSNPTEHSPYHFESSPLLVVISGPSGAGKDATLNRMEELGYPFHFVVTATTRPRRPNEVDGVDYHFVSEQEFAEMLEKNELLEHAIVYGQHKGIPKKQVREALESGKDVIMRIDVQGAATIRRLVPEAVFVFLTASSEEELSRRLEKRRTETPEGLKRRIATAWEEMKRLDEFDYVVVNRDSHLDETVETIAAIITAEKCKVKQRRIELQGGVRWEK
ncbi:MAG: guanylate kinase [Anaerolineales bacterium]|nr:guanylate kinase [Anaerolineales bacterium]